ncbi:MAG: bifunctional metallophosphatase/5'-nucleotidase [Bacteroidota bacterium]
MKTRTILLFFALFCLSYSCTTYRVQSLTDDGKLSFQILQVNDVYEIAPLENGRVGGMARVAQLKKEMLAKNPNTIAVLAGDFLNPSVIGALKQEGKRISGKQMVEAMNVAGIDLVTFGNHEFDVKEHELMARLEESDFEWIGSNVLHQTQQGTKPFQRRGSDVPEYVIQTFEDADGTKVKVGFISTTITSNPKDYVQYEDVFEEIKRLYKLVAPEVDLVLAITHLKEEDDLKVAKILPKVPLLMGGHDHHNMKIPVRKTVLTKADANAKSAYWHTIHFDKGKITIDSELKELNEHVELDAETDKVVQKWMAVANDLLEKNGINPERVITKLSKPMDAREAIVRHQPTAISDLITEAYLSASPEADGAILNCGSIRIDDILEGTLTEYDIVRTLPFGGSIYTVKMKGKLLEKRIRIIFIALQESV